MPENWKKKLGIYLLYVYKRINRNIFTFLNIGILRLFDKYIRKKVYFIIKINKYYIQKMEKKQKKLKNLKEVKEV